MCEPDTHQAILQAVTEPKVIAKGSEKEGGEEKEREGEHPFGTKDVSFSNAFREEKSFSKCQVSLLELSSNVLQICRCAEVTGVLRCHWTPHPWKRRRRRRSSSSSATLPTSRRQPLQWETSLWFVPNIYLYKHLMWQRPAFLTDLKNFSSSRPEHFAWKVCSYFFLSVDFSLQMPKREINCSNCVQSSQSKGFGQCLRFVF